jgi:predicted helicase
MNSKQEQETFLMNCYEKAFVIYSYDKNLHLAHLENSDMPLKDFLKAYKVKMRELTDEEVIYTP